MATRDFHCCRSTYLHFRRPHHHASQGDNERNALIRIYSTDGVSSRPHEIVRDGPSSTIFSTLWTPSLSCTATTRSIQHFLERHAFFQGNWCFNGLLRKFAVNLAMKSRNPCVEISKPNPVDPDDGITTVNVSRASSSNTSIHCQSTTQYWVRF